MNITHPFVSAVADDVDTSTVSPSNWNADHTVSLPDGAYLAIVSRLVLPGTDRFTEAGTSRMSVRDVVRAFRGTYGIGSLSVLDDSYQLQYKRATLNGTARVTLGGTGELYMFDLAPVGRLILAGRGL